ncbi:MAG: PmoA family protein [Opitutaceae bacterium]
MMPPFSVLQSSLLAVLAFSAAALSAAEVPEPVTIRVHAGSHDRLATAVRVRIGDSRTSWQLTGPDGQILPHQLNLGSDLVFRTGRIAAGATADYRFGPASRPADTSPGGILTHYDEEGLRFAGAGESLAFYRIVPIELEGTGIDPLYRRAGYLHPLRTLNGVTVTDDFPPDHLHHHGIWSAWTRTGFQGRNPDFWNMGKGSGGVAFKSLEEAWEGPVEAGFIASHEFFERRDDGLDQPVLIERWTTHIHAPHPEDAGAWFFDLELEQTTAGPDPLELLEYHYGGVAVRGNGAWNGAENAHFLNADGESDRIAANASRNRWCAMSGPVDGAIAGIAFLDHPENLRSPQPLRVHPTEPYFCYSPSQLGPFTIDPNTPYRARYRIVVFDGEADPGQLDRLWNDFAHPPEVETIDSDEPKAVSR